MKRAFDIVISFAALVILSPLFFALAVLIRAILGSPVIYSQTRPGLRCESFRLYKFRTMTNKKDQKGNLVGDDQRMTRLGRFLRASSLDELPQLANVLLGNMSLVGPRPLLMEYLPLYSAAQRRRHEVKPGLTGWAQVSGRNVISWEDKFNLDIWYVDNRSLWLDLRILGLTLKKVVQADGISQPGNATMTRFTGREE